MAQNPAESAASIKNKLKESREKEEECVRNLKENQLQLVQARKEAVDVIYAHQRVVLRLNEEIAQGAEDLVNVQVHYRTEREKMLSGFVGDLLRKIREKEVAENVHVAVPIPDAPKFVVPRHTPTIRCFLPEHLEKPGSYRCTLKIAECEEFMTLTNQERLELLFSQHRCFGCFLPVSVAGHNTLPDCPHPRCYLETITRSSVALGALTRGSCRKKTERRHGPAVTYGAALTGRIVAISWSAGEERERYLKAHGRARFKATNERERERRSFRKTASASESALKNCTAVKLSNIREIVKLRRRLVNAFQPLRAAKNSRSFMSVSVGQSPGACDDAIWQHSTRRLDI
ncbi:hypothetical protein OUZ56_005705 [Daphnia magna]|uniref:Uncharacterized protein n=1 Tax=Daphnia magna TaxID=35525 RepID=A0ABQ9YTK3_9CRUS|nr:hypothetical protein OUZ56_005705 [Daphnia magna]